MKVRNNEKIIKAMKWMGQYICVAIISVVAFYGARSYVGTKYEILQSNVDKSKYNVIIEFLEQERVPYMVSIDKKRIRVPNYTIPRLQYQLSKLLTDTNVKGGY